MSDWRDLPSTIAVLRATLPASKPGITPSEALERLNRIKTAVDAYLEFVREDYHCDRAEDYECDVFEAAVEAYYGEGIWQEVDAWVKRAEEALEGERP